MHLGSLHFGHKIHMKREFNPKLSGNEVYYTNYSTLLVKNMLCSKLNCHKGFHFILISVKNGARAIRVRCSFDPSISPRKNPDLLSGPFEGHADGHAVGTRWSRRCKVEGLVRAWLLGLELRVSPEFRVEVSPLTRVQQPGCSNLIHKHLQVINSVSIAIITRLLQYY